MPLPYPEPGGSFEPLRECLNLNRHDHEWIMLVSWITGTFQPDGPFPILFLYGEQGSAKSTATRLLRTLVDPSRIPLRTLSRSARDLAIAASACWCVSFDNVSNISLPLSDALCRLATGGGLATRQLYTDRDEVQFTWKRPIIMNGITNFAERHDLSDRGIVINMPTIPKEARRTERDIRWQWGKAMPGVLGAICTAVSGALRNLHQTKLEGAPRMADFAQWITAAEPSLPWEPGQFLAEYENNRKVVEDLALEAEPVSMALIEMMAERDEWTGTASELLSLLSDRVRGELRRLAVWPKAPHILSSRLKRSAGCLKARGIEIEWGKSGTRKIRITKRRE